MTSPIIKTRAEHSISRTSIDPDVLKVLYRLHNSGWKGYLVGGSVRDLLLGRRPKDFDVGTDAHPHQIKHLFRNCRIIGRRFRLAHILFSGGKAVEVSTFRRRPQLEGGEAPGDLLVTEDNTFGTPVEDALRRDFTINGLFYDISSFSVIDHVGGLEDLDNRIVRVIGDPDIRLREDPVRMLRAIEFASRLDFTLTLETYDAIVRHRREILRSSPPRVTEELLGMLRGPRPLATFRMLREMGLLEILLPELVAAVAAHTDPDRGEDGTLLWKYLGALERRTVRSGSATNDAVLVAILLLPLVFSSVAARIKGGGKVENPELVTLIDEIVEPIALRLTLPNALLHTVKQAIFSLGRLDEPIRSAAHARRFLHRQYFTTAFELFKIHAEVTGRHAEAVARWERIRLMPPEAEEDPAGRMATPELRSSTAARLPAAAHQPEAPGAPLLRADNAPPRPPAKRRRRGGRRRSRTAEIGSMGEPGPGGS